MAMDFLLVLRLRCGRRPFNINVGVVVLIRVAKKPSTINTQPSQQLLSIC